MPLTFRSCGKFIIALAITFGGLPLHAADTSFSSTDTERQSSSYDDLSTREEEVHPDTDPNLTPTDTFLDGPSDALPITAPTGTAAATPPPQWKDQDIKSVLVKIKPKVAGTLFGSLDEKGDPLSIVSDVPSSFGEVATSCARTIRPLLGVKGAEAQRTGAYSSNSSTPLANWFVVDVLPDKRAEDCARRFKLNAEVVTAEENGSVTINQAVNDPLLSELWGFSRIKTQEAWPYCGQGQGVVVAVIDTGVLSTHPDLSERMWTNSDEIAGNQIDDDGNGYVDDARGWDFISSDNNPLDEHSHGTHVAGTIAATVGNGVGIAGIAPQARIMPVQVLSSTGGGTWSSVALGVRYAADNGAHIMNLSIGGPGESQLLIDAAEYARQRGTLMVVAAANNYTWAQYFTPANIRLANVLTVAAVTRTDERALFSNFGLPVGIAAPGVEILSTVLNNNYASFAGTSMAAPHVAGAAALLKSKFPTFSAEDLKNALRFSADSIQIAGAAGYIGSGRLNALKACQMVAPPPSAWISSGVAQAGLVTISGTANAASFKQYTLSYGPWTDAYSPPATFTTIRNSTSPVDNSTLGSIVLGNGLYWFKLIVEDTSGVTSTSFLSVFVGATPPPPPSLNAWAYGRVVPLKEFPNRSATVCIVPTQGGAQQCKVVSLAFPGYLDFSGVAPGSYSMTIQPDSQTPQLFTMPASLPLTVSSSDVASYAGRFFVNDIPFVPATEPPPSTSQRWVRSALGTYIFSYTPISLPLRGFQTNQNPGYDLMYHSFVYPPNLDKLEAVDLNSGRHSLFIGMPDLIPLALSRDNGYVLASYKPSVKKIEFRWSYLSGYHEPAISSFSLPSGFATTAIPGGAFLANGDLVLVSATGVAYRFDSTGAVRATINTGWVPSSPTTPRVASDVSGKFVTVLFPKQGGFKGGVLVPTETGLTILASGNPNDPTSFHDFALYPDGGTIAVIGSSKLQWLDAKTLAPIGAPISGNEFSAVAVSPDNAITYVADRYEIIGYNSNGEVKRYALARPFDTYDWRILEGTLRVSGDCTKLVAPVFGKIDPAGTQNGANLVIETGRTCLSRRPENQADWFHEYNGSGTRVRSTVRADMNDDGMDDMVIFTKNQLFAEFSQGTSFKRQLLGSLASNVTWYRPLLGDFNGDGRGDLCAHKSNGEVKCLYSSVAQWTESGVSSNWSSSYWTHLRVGDFDGDGRDDVAKYQQSTGKWVVFSSMNGTDRDYADITNGTAFSSLIPGDYNGDGKWDIAGRISNGQWKVFLSTGAPNATFTMTNFGTWGGTFGEIRAFDVDADGLTDILGRSSNGSFYIARSNGSSFTTSVFCPWNVGTTMRDFASYDVNDDGKTDLVGVSTNGTLWVRLAGATSTANWGSWGTTPWKSIFLGRFTHSALADLIAREPASITTSTPWTYWKVGKSDGHQFVSGEVPVN